MPIPRTHIFSQLEEYYGCKLPRGLRGYEEYNDTPLNEADFEKIKIYHPRMEDERFKLLAGFQMAFLDLFKFDRFQQASETIQEDSSLRKIFNGYEEVRYPRKEYDHYILNKVVDGVDFDLKKDIHAHV
jgi:hypothetical protein|tara:strand:+ start:1128 stop:1514 length:387 start_codon:yes stop_codon:yes gene_type:complete